MPNPPVLHLAHSRRGRSLAITLAGLLVLTLGYAQGSGQTMSGADALPLSAAPPAPVHGPSRAPVALEPVADPGQVAAVRRTSPITSADRPAQTSFRSPAPAGGSAYTSSSFAYAVLAQLNAERAGHGRPPLQMNRQLLASAHAHNLAMARANQMSHQVPGEAYFTDRISAAGYRYRDAGENIGWNSEISRRGVLELESMMYAEGPPPAGQVNHYSNIVNPHYTEVGIEVWVDTVHHKLWLTEDFGDR